MEISKIVIEMNSRTHLDQKPPQIELGPHENALIPNVGDIARVEGFSILVRERRFTFSPGQLTIDLFD